MGCYCWHDIENETNETLVYFLSSERKLDLNAIE